LQTVGLIDMIDRNTEYAIYWLNGKKMTKISINVTQLLMWVRTTEIS